MKLPNIEILIQPLTHPAQRALAQAVKVVGRIRQASTDVFARGASKMERETDLDLVVKKKFTFHKPDRAGIEKMRTIRRHVRSLAAAIEILCPEGPEREKSFEELQSCMMFANSSIVQEFPLDENDV